MIVCHKNILITRKTICCRAGDGANGAPYKYDPRIKTSRPLGHGGDGGSVYVRGNQTILSLKDISNHISATAGSCGQRYSRGKRGLDAILHLPMGSLVSYQLPDGELIPHVRLDGSETILVACGGSGGRGGSSYQHKVDIRIGEKGQIRYIDVSYLPKSDVCLIGARDVRNHAFYQTFGSLYEHCDYGIKSFIGSYMDEYERRYVIAADIANEEDLVKRSMHVVLVLDPHNKEQIDEELSRVRDADVNLHGIIYVNYGEEVITNLPNVDQPVLTLNTYDLHINKIQNFFNSFYKCT